MPARIGGAALDEAICRETIRCKGSTVGIASEYFASVESRWRQSDNDYASPRFPDAKIKAHPGMGRRPRGAGNPRAYSVSEATLPSRSGRARFPQVSKPQGRLRADFGHAGRKCGPTRFCEVDLTGSNPRKHTKKALNGHQTANLKNQKSCGCDRFDRARSEEG